MKCNKIFKGLKKTISSELLLRLPNFMVSFEVHTDALDKAISGVLVQDNHLFTFESKKLNLVKQIYYVHEIEMVVVVYCSLETEFH